MSRLLKWMSLAGLAGVLMAWPALLPARADDHDRDRGNHYGWTHNRGHHYGWLNNRRRSEWRRRHHRRRHVAWYGTLRDRRDRDGDWDRGRDRHRR